MKYALFCFIIMFTSICILRAQPMNRDTRVDTTQAAVETVKPVDPKAKIFYGMASYYADKFHGRQTASGELYDADKMTAACNALPLGSWVKVTNLSNNKFVIVRTNDRLHPKMTRIVDLSRSAAEKLGYIGKGLTKVKVEVLQKK